MRHFSLIMFSVIFLFAAPPVFANTVGIDLFVGNSWHINQPIRIGDHIFENPQWETRPFSDAWYYSIRVRWGTVEVELLHDKVYMGYDTDYVQDFNMSDGYNHVLFNVVQTWGPWEGRLGVGPMIVHPEGTVTTEDGSYLIGYLGAPSWRVGGIGFQGSVGYRGRLWEGLSYIAEGKMTTAIVHLTYPEPVREVYAPVTGYHVLVGVGYDL